MQGANTASVWSNVVKARRCKDVSMNISRPPNFEAPEINFYFRDFSVLRFSRFGGANRSGCRSGGTSAKTTLLETTLLRTPEDVAVHVRADMSAAMDGQT